MELALERFGAEEHLQRMTKACLHCLVWAYRRLVVLTLEEVWVA